MNCYYKENWYQIYDIQDFEELIDKNVYYCLIHFIENEYEKIIKDLRQELYWIENKNYDLNNENDDLQCEVDELRERIEELEEQLDEQ